MFLSPTQNPVILVRVPSSDEQLKLLFRITTLAAKFEDLSPCIFQLQIQPGFHQLSPILALPTHRDVLDFFNHAPLLPKTTVQQMKHMHEELDTTMPDILILNPMLILQVVYLFKLRPLNFPWDIIKNFFLPKYDVSRQRDYYRILRSPQWLTSLVYTIDKLFQRQQPTQKKQPAIRDDCVSCSFVLTARTASAVEMGFREACLRLSQIAVSWTHSGAQRFHHFIVNLFILITHTFSA